MNDLVKKWVRPEILRQKAYHVPDAGNYIKLDAMENPFSWPDDLRREWQAALADTALNRYPDPEAGELAVVLRKEMGISDELGVIFGNGSDELIQLIMLSVAKPGRTILSVDPSFVMYSIIATLIGLEYQSVPLQTDFNLDEASMLAAIEQYQPAVVFIAYPNNPTGNLFNRKSIDAIIQASPGIVVIDEAYHAFAGDSYLADIGKYDNLLVLRTLSKLGLAGIRLGFLIGSVSWLSEINKTRAPYNINVLTQATAKIALQHSDVFDEQTKEICRQRKKLFDELSAIKSIKAYPSQANFILFRVAKGKASPIFEHLKNNDILIKNLHGSAPALADCLRVTVGMEQQNDAFLAALKSAAL